LELLVFVLDDLIERPDEEDSGLLVGLVLFPLLQKGKDLYQEILVCDDKFFRLVLFLRVTHYKHLFNVHNTPRNDIHLVINRLDHILLLNEHLCEKLPEVLEVIRCKVLNLGDILPFSLFREHCRNGPIPSHCGEQTLFPLLLFLLPEFHHIDFEVEFFFLGIFL
jgi:hypothetical protein